MTTDRRQRVLRLYHLALAHEGDERARVLSDACADDDALRHEVEALLAQNPPDDFLEAPALNAVTGSPVDDASALVGRQIGAYRIDSTLGSGGMGDVYRATDTVLGRAVAIKVISPAFTFDAARRARLEREAKALAALNHPHIAHVYGFQAMPDAAGNRVVNALVMELVHGVTLTNVLQKGPLAIDDALRIGLQIADALAAAHAHGIVHRDVKPANVMIGESGVKVLDFGLAKLAGVTSDLAETALPRGEEITGANELLGTMAYMSPEQAEGKPVDARSDVFSLGVVLYEMLCGKRPFRGETAISTLAATLKSAPLRPRVVRKDIPVTLERIVLRCLEKTPEARYASARDVHQALSAHLASRSARGITRQAALLGAAAVVIIGLAGLSVRSYVQASRVRWVETVAAPEIERLLIENRRMAAADLYRTAERYAPASRALRGLAEGVEAAEIAITTTPPGARIYISDYAAAAGDDLAEWRLLGETPFTTDWIPRWGYYRIRAERDGFASAERAQVHQSKSSVAFTLHTEEDTPAGMVWVPATTAALPLPLVGSEVSLPGFWIDRYEVTNRQFKTFVEAGGYEKEEYWKEPFVKDGRLLSWQEAVVEFRDSTNRPGPAGWLLGTYPEGTDNMPVGGVSWYEAAAYAVFAAKSLPTLHEWWIAAGENNLANSDILTLSSFGGRGPEPIGVKRGMARFGTFDMAGNMKEWATNSSTDGRRYLLGGSWVEESYTFTLADPWSAFSRDRTYGFRCVRRTTSLPDEAFQSYDNRSPLPRRTPVDDATFQRFLDIHSYDKTNLESKIDRVDDTPRDWRRETVSFQAGPDNTRAMAHLFLPKGSKPPYQVVVYVGGSGIHARRKVEEIADGYKFILLDGRAVVIPVLSGTLERGPSSFRLPPRQDRERNLRWSTEMSRTLDYLETRSDFDIERLGYYGLSAGANYGVRFIAIDGRFKTAVLASGGLFDRRELEPETDALNFAPRVYVPLLMLNGRDDFIHPYETSQRPLFEALGTKQKELKRYNGGHDSVAMRPDLIREILDWFDKYLGPVDQRP
jgi:formylglycine-generating enzyme required for sulfatase activity/dienelactone hydrolase